jgi:hypothetical protein
MINQTLRNRYIRENRLTELLQRLFASDFRVEVLQPGQLTGGIVQLRAFSLTREFRKRPTITF